MKVNQKEISGTIILELVGDLDFHTSPQIRELLQMHINNQTSKLVINLSRVGYIDSSGLATFVEVYQKMRKYGAKFVLCLPTAAVKSVFEIAKLETIFCIAETEEEALKAC